MKYFGHDTNARRDPKVRKLIKKYGAKGYGIYFGINEMIAEKIEPPRNLNCLLEEDYEQVADDLNETPDVVRTVSGYCIELGLFSLYGEIIQNTKILKRKDEYTEKKIRALSGQSPDSVLHKERKGKEIKGKETGAESAKSNGFADSGMTEDEFKTTYPDIYKKLKAK